MAHRKQLLAMCALACLCIQSAHAGRWHTNADLDLLTDYTGNVFLESEDTQADLVLRVRPIFSADRKGSRLSVSARYAPEYRYFVQGSQSNKLVHYFNGGADLLLIKRILGVKAKATSGQSLINSNFNFTNDALTNPDNITNTTTLRFTPYLLPIRLGNYATLSVTSDLDFVGYSNSDLDSSRGSQLEARLTSGPKFSPFRWDLKGRQRLTTYDSNSGESAYDELIGGLHYRVNRAWTLDTAYGIDNAKTEADNEFNNNRWLVGFTWTPTSRAILQFGIGERFGESDYVLRFNYKHKRSCWYANYDKDISSSRSELADGSLFSTSDRLCNVIENSTSTGEALGVGIGPPIRSGSYISDKFRVGFNWVLNRTVVDITGQYDRRDYLDISEISNDLGLFLKVSRNLTPRSSVSVSTILLYHREEESNVLDYDQYSATINYTYAVTQETNFVFGYRLTNRDNRVGEGFVEDRLNLSLVSTYN